MKTMRILSLAVMALALALAPGVAKADFVLRFDNPDTTAIDFEIRDQGAGDTAPAEGLISVAIEESGLTVVASAESKADRGSPDLLLSINFLRYSGGSLEISLTDTDFTVDAPQEVSASVLAGFVEGGESIRFDFFGDNFNGEFEKTSEIVSIGPLPSPDLNISFPDQQGSAGPVGSLTMSAFAVGGSGSEFEINTSFTMALQFNPGAPPPPVEAECPPNIIDRTVDGVKVVGDCLISGSTIERGDVEVSGVANFEMQSSRVKSGDIDIKNVETSVVVIGTIVDNGGIEVSESVGVVIDDNIVNGKISVSNNEGAKVIRNFSNADVEVSRNTGSGEFSTKVRRNIVIGTGNIDVDDNEVARVIRNKVSRSIECEDNGRLISRGNEAGQKNECPKPERELFD